MTTEELISENARLAEQNQALSHRIKLLEGKLDAVLRRLFGHKSEQLDDRQLLLLLGLQEGTPSTAGTRTEDDDGDGDDEGPGGGGRRRRAASRRGEGLPAGLPVEETVVLPDEVVRRPEQYREISRNVTDLLDYQPPRYFIQRTVRPVFVRRDAHGDEAPVTAPLARRVLERGMAAPGLIASMIVAKYCDHVPLYRQEVGLRTRHDIRISRQNMARWMQEAAFWLEPIYRLIRREVFTDGYVQVDEPSGAR